MTPNIDGIECNRHHNTSHVLSQWEVAIGGVRVTVPKQTPEWLPGQVLMERALPKKVSPGRVTHCVTSLHNESLPRKGDGL